MNLHEMLTKTAEAEAFYRLAYENATESVRLTARLVSERERKWKEACERLDRLKEAEGIDPEGLEEAQKAEAVAYDAMAEAEDAYYTATNEERKCEEAYEAARRFYASLQAFK